MEELFGEVSSDTARTRACSMLWCGPSCFAFSFAAPYAEHARSAFT